MPWFVSRQQYFGVEPEERYMVEIAAGGLNYANADMLVSKYSGEGQEYADPREAVNVALEIAEAWQKDKPEIVVNVGHGATGGMTMPFEGSEKDELIAWGEETWEGLEKCPCGEVMEGAKEWYRIGTFTSGGFYPDDSDVTKCCSERCSEKYSSYQCDGDECDGIFYGEEEGKEQLKEVDGKMYCHVCRLLPCGECKKAFENHADEDHEYEKDEKIEERLNELKVWDSGPDKGMDRYTVVWPDDTYLAMNAYPFHPQGFGQHGECRGIYNRVAGTEDAKNSLGDQISLYDLPEDCVKCALQDVVLEIKEEDETEGGE